MTITTMEMVIGEARSTGASDQWLDVINPATEEVQARVPAADARDVDEAVRVASQAFDQGPWSRMMPSDRGKLLYSTHGTARIARRRASPVGDSGHGQAVRPCPYR